MSTFVVTGGSSGIGYFVSEQLARQGHSVIIAARTASKADAAMASIRIQVPGAELFFVPFDLDSLASVRTAAAQIAALGPIDGVALNAGLTSPTKGRELTDDGLEKMVGGNYVAHFALVAQLWPALSPTARVVSMGSMSTRLAKADLENLMQQRGKYNASKAYAYSKHGMQGFGFELDRRLREAGSGIQSLVAHPGFAMDVQAPRRPGVNDHIDARFAQNLLRPMTQGKDRGAWPMVKALTDMDARGGDFFGPPNGLKGKPKRVKAVAQDTDPAFGQRLWQLSEGWAGLTFDV